MPFNIGPFEVIVAVIVIGGFLLLVIKPRAGQTQKVEAMGLASRSVAELVADGWRIESESAEYVFLVKGRPVNHLLHFFVGIFTLGIWWISGSWWRPTAGSNGIRSSDRRSR